MILTPPQNTSIAKNFYKIFLAGSIEMGNAEPWQEDMAKKLDDNNTIIFNPRRADWDNSWEQDIENPQFFQQVTWELDCLEKAHTIIFYFQPGTKSPISLLELGLYARSNKRIIVVCPQGFWRKGNVDIICQKFNIQQESSLQEAVDYIFNTKNSGYLI